MGTAGAADLRATQGERPRKTDMRTAMNAILYLLRTGCPWRYLAETLATFVTLASIQLALRRACPGAGRELNKVPVCNARGWGSANAR